MPLLDHFHAPLSRQHHWENMHSAWTNALRNQLNEVLPEQYFAEVQISLGDLLPAAPGDVFEVRVFTDEEGLRLVAAVELISPSNKDRPGKRHVFAVKCASYLHQGIGLIVVDIVTNRTSNLHRQLLELLGLAPPPVTASSPDLYAVAYRTKPDGERLRLDQ